MFFFTCFQKKLKKWIKGGVGGIWPIRVFLGFLDFWIFFNLKKPLSVVSVEKVTDDMICSNLTQRCGVKCEMLWLLSVTLDEGRGP